MLEHIELNKLRESEGRLYGLRGFTPRIVDQAYLRELKIEVKPTMEIIQELQRGSSVFVERYAKRSLVPELSCGLKNIPLDEPLKSHRYTCKCPIDFLEIDPMVGCNLNCLYCLVTDGDHSAPKIAYKNYGSYLRHKLEDENGVDHIYYFAPKTEPFQEATLQTGIAHDILREFIAYFKRNSKSKSKVLIVSKAGKEELQYKNNGNTILDLLRELSDKVIYATSISVIPPELYPILEPRAASNEARLEAAVMCQEYQIPAHAALVQPIIPAYFTDQAMNDLLKNLKKANIVKFKPEFLTLSIQNLAWMGEVMRYFDKSMAKELYELYIAPENITNVKHKNRMAPDRDFTRKAILKLKERADEYGLIMTLCHWVRSELNIGQTEVPLIARENWNKISWVCKEV